MIKFTVKPKRTGVLLSMFVTSVTPSYAAMSDIQASVYAGISRTHINTSMLHISPKETDFLEKNNTSDAIEGLGLTYAFNFLNKENRFIQNITLGVYYFHFDTAIGGHVLLYDLPQFPNYNYTLTLKTNRLLVGTELDLMPIWQGFTPFVDVGIGVGFIKSHYFEEPILATMTYDGQLNLANRNTSNFTYSLGGGIKKSVTPHVTLSLSYLYTDLGTASTSTMSNLVIIESPIKARLRTHSGLLGLSYHF